jgi:hypothetical protein
MEQRKGRSQTMITREYVIASFKEIDERIAREKAEKARPQPAAVKREERWTKKPEVVFNAAADHNRAAQELAQVEAVRRRYQAELDRWWQSMRDADAVGQFLEPDYNPIELYERTTYGRGRR